MNIYLSIFTHLLIVLFSLYCFSRLTGFLISWILSSLTKHTITISHVTLLGIHNIRVRSPDNSSSIYIKHISIVSKLFSNSIRLFGLFVGETEVKVWSLQDVLKTKKTKTISIDTISSDPPKQKNKLPFFIIYIIQRVHIKIESLKIFLKDESINVTASLSTGIDFVSFPDTDNRFVSSHFAVDHIEVKVKEDKSSYLNLSCGVKLDLLLSYNFEKIETVNVSADMLSLILYEGLLDLVKQYKSKYKSNSLEEVVTKTTTPVLKSVRNLLPKIPKDRSIRLQNISCSISDKEQTRNISFKIESLVEKGAHDIENGTIIDNINMNNAKVYINNTDFLSIGSLKISPIKVTGLSEEERLVALSVTSYIDMPVIKWYNTELLSWVSSIPPTNATTPSSRRGLALSVTSRLQVTNFHMKLFEDSKQERNLITFTAPSLDFHYIKYKDKLSIGFTSKKLLLQIPIPVKVKRKLRDKLSVINESHVWGQILDLRSFTVKVQKYNELTQVDVDLQNSVIEWNYHLSNLIMELMPQFIILIPQPNKRVSTEPSSSFNNIELACKIIQLNVFLLSNEPGEVCTLLHVHKLTLEQRSTRTNVELENLYLHAIERLPEFYLCNIELEESDNLLSVTKCWLSREARSVTCEVQSVAVYWEPTLHRVVDTCISKTKGSIVCIRDLLMYQKGPPLSDTEDTPISTKLSYSVNVNVTRSFMNFITSPSNQLSIETSPCVIRLDNNLVCVAVKDYVTIVMDSHQILRIMGAELRQVVGDEDLLALRSTQPEFAPTNKAWSFTCREFNVFLPHNYGRTPQNNRTIAEAIDEAQNCFKMLKGLHRAPRLASDGEGLYADCKIKIDLLLVEFEDYEFDQKISRNYLIMQHAQQDIAPQLSERHNSSEDPLLESDQLNLSELADNSFSSSFSFWETYYHYHNHSEITSHQESEDDTVKLATLLIRDIHLCVCADETLNGHDNVVDMIDTLDDGTEVPPDLKFTTLWGRAIHGSCSIFTLQLRNFKSELVHIEQLTVDGIICGAEAVSPNHAIRKTKVMLRKPWKNFELARGMNALKYFYNLIMDCERMNLAYGPCIEPSYQFFGQCLDRCTKNSRDPSKVLPFWDKARNLLRGELVWKARVFEMRALSEREPHKNSEYLSIFSKDYTITWTNGQLSFTGDTVIKNNSESKYGECKIVTLPRLSISVGMIWKTPNDPNDHWSCVPYDPKFVKQLEDGQKWDSFKNFRSICLDLDVSLKFRKGEEEDEAFPKVNVFSHTFKWLNAWASVVIGSVSRPVFKGKHWNNLKPPKKKLTRHYRRVYFETEFDKAELEIWSSYRKRAGAKISVKSGKLSMTHKLALVAWPAIEVLDGEGNTAWIELKRRSRASWSTEKCAAHFEDIQGTLMGSTESMSDSYDIAYQTKSSPEHFLFSIDFVEYRQRGELTVSTESLNSVNSRDSKIYTHWMVISDLKACINIGTRTLILAFLEQYENSKALTRDLSSEALRTISLDQENQRRKSPRESALFAETSPNQSNDDLLYLSSFDEDQVTIVTGEESSSASKEKLAAEQACSNTDIKNRKWSIQMKNGQLAMQGPEFNGFVMLTTGKCQVLGSEHWPVLRGGEFFSKFSWTCIVEHVQYFSTVDEASDCEIPWLDEAMISLRRGRYNSSQDPGVEPGVEDIEDQEESLKGIVREVYKHDTKVCATQLQRIVSRCGCLLSFVTFGSQPIEDKYASTEFTEESVLSSDLLSAFSLRHKSLEVATNTHQYKMILDCVNNLLLRTEGSKRSSIGRLLHAFSLMRSGEEEARKTIATYQKEIRDSLLRIRDLERALYEFDLSNQPALDRKDKTLKLLINEKQKLNANRIRLRLTISAFKEFKLKEGAINKEQFVDQLMEVRKNEICIDDANWTLTGECGQIPFMEVNIQGGFAYSRTVYSTESTETLHSPEFSSAHKFTLGHFCIKNLYNCHNPQNVLFPMYLNEDEEKQRSYCLRVHLRQQHNPVGGIIINEYLEINLVHLVLRFETAFWREIQKFFVGEDRRDEDGVADYEDMDDSSSINPLNYELRHSKRDKKFKFTSRKNVGMTVEPSHRALDEMSERSKKRFFNFVKIQEFPISISYKGKITVNEKTVLFPNVIIKERTQTWKELALEIKRISVPKIALSLGKLKHSYSTPIPVLSSLGVGNNSNLDETVRNQEVYRFLTGSDVDNQPKKKRGLSLSLKRNKTKKAAPPIPARPTLVPRDEFVKEVDNPGEWEDNTLGDRINELKAMSEDPLTPSPTSEVRPEPILRSADDNAMFTSTAKEDQLG